MRSASSLEAAKPHEPTMYHGQRVKCPLVTMDDMPIPHLPYKEMYDKEQRSFNLILGAGVVFFAITAFFVHNLFSLIYAMIKFVVFRSGGTTCFNTNATPCPRPIVTGRLAGKLAKPRWTSENSLFTLQMKHNNYVTRLWRNSST